MSLNQRIGVLGWVYNVNKKSMKGWGKAVKSRGGESLVLFGVLFLLVACEQTQSKQASQKSILEGPRVGFRAPGFSVPALDGRSLSLADYRGQVVMINFWATWCVPCRVEMPSMENLYERYGGRGFEILAVSGGEGPNVVQPFIKNLKLSFPILLDERFEVHEKYEVSAIPSTFLVDKGGVVTHRFFGAVDWNDDQFKELIGKLIKAKE
jgi:peroxiredoxin